MSEIVTWRPKLAGKDKHGRVPPDPFGVPVDLVHCLVAPTRSEDLVAMTRDGEVLAWDVFAQRQVVRVSRGDQVIIRGETFVVESMPFQWVPARRRSANHGTRFTAVRQEG